MKVIKGSLMLLGDSVEGSDKENEGKLYAVSLDDFGDIAFVLREKKHYISQLDLDENSEVKFQFRKDKSPKFGDCWLLEGYGTGKMIWCEGRRILIHRGNSPANSAGCWIVGRVTDTTFKSCDVVTTPRVTDSVATLARTFELWPGRIVFLLKFRGGKVDEK